MNSDEMDRYIKIARQLTENLDEHQKEVLLNWIEQILQLKASNLSMVDKVKKAFSLTANNDFISATAKIINDTIIPKELARLMEELMKIKASTLTGTAKVSEASKLLAQSLKSVAWDNRSLPARLALSASIAVVIMFGGQGAGIAALGSAIGVPLWVLFGAGAGFLGVLYEELTGKKYDTKATYRVINVEPEQRTYYRKYRP